MSKLTNLDQELFYIISSLPLLDERTRQVALQKFTVDFSKIKNKNVSHPLTRQTYWSSAILSLHRSPSEEIIGIILKLLKSDINVNQRLKSKTGDVHSALLLTSGLFSDKTSIISESMRWRTLDTLLRLKSLNLNSYDNNNYAIMIRDIVWKYKSDSKECKSALTALKVHTGDASSNPVSLFNENELKLELKKQDKDTVLKSYLQKMAQASSFKKSMGSPDTDSIKKLLDKFPNFESVIHTVLPEVGLYKISVDPLLHLIPILLVGEPGIGKTKFVNTLAKTLGLDFKRIDCGSLTAHWVLSGINSTWKDAKPGEVATVLIDGPSINPLLMLDEIDKMNGDRNSDPFSVLHNLLERETSRTFKDEFIGINIDASHISWIATANDISIIPDSILSRFRVINVPSPSKKQMSAIIDSVYTDLLEEYNSSWGSKFSKIIPYDVKSCLLTESPRALKSILLMACGVAASTRSEDTFILQQSDITQAYQNPSIRKNQIGFQQR